MSQGEVYEILKKSKKGLNCDQIYKKLKGSINKKTINTNLASMHRFGEVVRVKKLHQQGLPFVYFTKENFYI